MYECRCSWYCQKCNDYHDPYHNHIVDYPKITEEEFEPYWPDGTPKKWNSLRLCWV